MGKSSPEIHGCFLHFFTIKLDGDDGVSGFNFP